MLCLAVATTALAQGPSRPPHLLSAQVPADPFNVQSGGIAAVDVTVDATGSVTSAALVQDVAPYGEMLRGAVQGWKFEPAHDSGHAAPSRVLVLGFFRPPMLTFAAPERPRYKDTTAPPEIPWPTSVTVPPYPPGALGSGKVILEVDVSAAGRVTSAHVLSPASGFDGAASDTARAWSFRPASRSGRPVDARAYLVFSFIGTTR